MVAETFPLKIKPYTSMITLNFKPTVAKTFTLAFMAAMLVFCVACSKSDDPAPEPVDPVSPGETVAFNKIITVLNFGADMPEGSQPLDEQSPIYFSLENNAAVPLAYKLTNRWDMSFSGIYRSFIGGNNGSNANNLGSGGPGKGGVVCLAKGFDEVTDVPADSEFKTASSVVGTDDSGIFGEGVGYYLYDFGGIIKGDGSYDSQHVAFALPETRTVVIRTAKGNYAKISILSLYKDLLDSKLWKRNSPHTYVTFKYVLAKAGSKKFTVEN
jgi:hypothetical protein